MDDIGISKPLKLERGAVKKMIQKQMRIFQLVLLLIQAQVVPLMIFIDIAYCTLSTLFLRILEIVNVRQGATK